MIDSLRVFMITCEWPSPDRPHEVPFIVRQVNFLRKAGIDLTLFPFHGGKRPGNYARAWRRAQAEIASGRYDLVHAQWGQSGILSLPKHTPLVVTFRGDDLEGIIGPTGHQNAAGLILKNISRLVARTADQVIVVSESLAQSMPRRSYHIIPSGLDLNLFRPGPQDKARCRLGLDPDRRYVLFAGSVGNPRKRYDLAKSAVDLLKADMDVELLVASRVDPQQIPHFMNASDTLLLTSIHEGSPNVVKEALACNLPVVSTDVGDVRQRIEHIDGCTMLEDDNLETIAAALRQVLIRGERIDGRANILDLDENILTQRVLEVYKQALQQK